ncbi:energy transducer TonB [Rhodohalobacter sulfatireducens]|uniref:Energy transducer TonB n=1 Tax=Rhodohalobacter sulfatireducens TaxID=2911366 RepID=A0ABS9KJL1_9BACT|nr:energy transducer TonB [Rhodohalobacter sulfatireducens]MCG2591021.1 energy transducer TonB [Rhodohalobacter sulfatireducens]MDR9366331.1 energy transducer TonB [Balneolaceae bacterium]
MAKENHQKKNRRLSDRDYRNLVLVSIIFVELSLILMIRLWPETVYEPKIDVQVEQDEVVALEDIQITRQQSSPPPPPKPQTPVPVPDDVIVEEELDFETELDLETLPLPEEGTGTALSGNEDRIVGNPQIPPSVVHIVEATAPKEVPEEYKGRLEMIVNFLVDQEGEVEEVSIMEIRLYERGGSDYEQLEYVQYGLMDAVLRAAMQWRFRPARQNGEPVKAFTRQRFNY